MATNKWSFLTFIKRICLAIGYNQPTALDASELASYPYYLDLIDITNDMIQEAMVRLLPEEIIKTHVFPTYTARAVENLTVTNGSATVTASDNQFVSSDVSATLPNRKLWVNGHNRVYQISTYTSEQEITIEDEYQGDTDTEATGYIFQDTYEMPDDYARMVENPGDFVTPWLLDVIPPGEFHKRRFSTGCLMNVATLTRDNPLIATFYHEEDSDQICLLIWPATNAVYEIAVPYYKQVTAFIAGTDNATTFKTDIPAQYQSLIVDMVVKQLYMYQQQDQRFQIADANMREKIGIIAANADKTKGDFKLFPDISQKGRRRMFGKRRSVKSLAGLYDLGDFFDRMD